MDTQLYRWPGFEQQLLEQLQKQQNSTLFCDTLLQTEGMSVPTHSCVLAALSPYLSQKLSAAPSPSAGQKRQLYLQAVKPHALLKLVGLLYSGQLEVKGRMEQNEVLATARRFGITQLVEVRTDSGRGRRVQSLSVQDAEVQAELMERGDENSPLRKKRCVARATQTDEGEDTGGYYINHSTPNVSAILDVSVAPRQDFGLDCSLTSCEETTVSALSCDLMGSLDASDSRISLQQPDDSDRTEGSDGRMAEGGGEEAGNSKRNEGGGMTNVAAMKLMETAHFSVKVKLKRRTQGAVWEVVGMQTQEEKLSAQRSLKQVQDRSRHTSPQREVQLPQPSKPAETLRLQPVDIDFPEPSEQLGPDSLLLPGQVPGSESEPLPQHLASLEESDEQLQKLLDDLMISLNIMPGLEGDCRKPQLADPGFSCGYESQNVSNCTSLLNVQPHLQIQGRDSSGCQNTPSSERKASLHPEEQDLVAATDPLPSRQKQGCPVSEQTPQQDFPECEETFSLADVDGLTLLPCISPIASCKSAARPPERHAQPKLPRRPWLKEESDLLQFPLRTMTSEQQADCSRVPKQRLDRVMGIATDGEACAHASRELAATVKLEPKATSTRSDSMVDGSAPKSRTRIRRSCPQRAEYRESEVSDVTRSVCSVNLSSDNVLVGKRPSSHNLRGRRSEKLQRTAGAAGPSSEWPRIRTRAFVRRFQEMANDSVAEKLVSTPVICKADTLIKPEPLIPKRGRGRPRKVKVEVSLAGGLLKEEPGGETKSEERRKRRRKMNEGEEIPSKRKFSPKVSDDDGDLRNPESNKQPETVAVVRQKISGRQEKSKKIQQTNHPEGDGSEAKRDGDDAMEESVIQVDESKSPQSRRRPMEVTGVDAEGRSASSSSVCSNESRRVETERKESPVDAEEEMSVSCCSLKHTETAALPLLSEAEVVQMSCCSIEEDGDIEVDVLICSPDQSPLISGGEDELHSMDIIADEEEEEEEEDEEIDVTAD